MPQVYWACLPATPRTHTGHSPCASWILRCSFSLSLSCVFLNVRTGQHHNEGFPRLFLLQIVTDRSGCSHAPALFCFAHDSWLACPVSFHPCCNLTFCSQSHATMAPSLEKLSSSLRCSGESAARRSAFASNWLNCNKQRADTAYSQKIRSMATRNKYRHL